MGWAEFAAAFAVFFLSHALPVRPPLQPRLEAALGARGFTLAYSALSLGVLAWLIVAAGRAPYVPLWSWAPWQAHVPLIAMLPACLIIALALGRPNPFSFGGARAERFDPARPGIVRWMRHPLLVALALWAFAHLVANGNLAHVVMFGLLGAFAILGGRLIDRRKRRIAPRPFRAHLAPIGDGRAETRMGDEPVMQTRRRLRETPRCQQKKRCRRQERDDHAERSEHQRNAPKHEPQIPQLATPGRAQPSISPIQVRAATARGRPSGPMDRSATCSSAARSTPSPRPRRV